MTFLPKPIPGLLIRYSYLWAEESDQGREDGSKDRPCAIVLSASGGDNHPAVVVLPVTHTPPGKQDMALEIPVQTKIRLGLDHERSWVVLTEANVFVWPGPDLRNAHPGDTSSVAYGELPASFFRDLRDAFLQAYRGRQLRFVRRTQ